MSFEKESLWKQVLRILSNELNNDMSFNTYLRPTKLTSLDNEAAIVAVPNTIIKDIIERRYLNLLKDILGSILQQSVTICLEITESTENCDLPEQLEIPDDAESGFSEGLPPCLIQKYTFDTFVVGNSNRFAHAASLAVAQSPAMAYNPLFVYGGVGLGKTHLMHAIGHSVMEQNQHLRVMYLSAEKFTNELIISIREDKNVEFRNKYRTVDVLLIDDIQFIAGKERTQEEFFHTFNALRDASKQIVISSDRLPKDIPTLEERLRSRFEWGLTTDIQAPDFETRMAILQKKAMMEQLIVPESVINYIATKIQTNIRELEGALIRIVAFSSLTDSPIDLNLAEEVLKEILPDDKPTIVTVPQILRVVGGHYSIKPDEFKAKRRTKDLAFARQVAMFLCSELTDLSLPKIGNEFGGRDHTTVIHARDKIAKQIRGDNSLSKTVDALKEKLLKG